MKSVQLSIPTDETEQTSQMPMYKMFWKNQFDNMVVSIFKAVAYLTTPAMTLKFQHTRDLISGITLR
jgi:hypothetical protein